MYMNKQLLEQAAKPSVKERIELVETIWDTVHESQNKLPLTAAQIALLEQRLTAYRENRVLFAPVNNNFVSTRHLLALTCI